MKLNLTKRERTVLVKAMSYREIHLLVEDVAEVLGSEIMEEMFENSPGPHSQWMDAAFDWGSPRLTGKEKSLANRIKKAMKAEEGLLEEVRRLNLDDQSTFEMMLTEG